MHSDLTKSRRQIIGHPASSANKNFLDLCLKLTFSMHFEKRFHRLMRTGNMKFIPCLKYIFPIRYKYFSLMFYRANKDFDLKLFIDCRKRHSYKTIVLRNSKLYQFNSSFYKRLNLTRNRKQKQTTDIIRHNQFRIHRHTKMKLFF